MAMTSRRFKAADSLSTYLDRAKLLAPSNPDVWYTCGVYELILGNDPNGACNSWRHCLQLSDVHLQNILTRSLTVVKPEQLLNKLLPDRAGTLFTAATFAYRDPGDEQQRRPLPKAVRDSLLERSLEVMERQTAPLKPNELYLKAEICSALGRSELAVQSLRGALLWEPNQFGWRLKLARLLEAQGQIDDALQQVALVLGGTPDSAEGRELQKQLAHRKAAGQTKEGAGSSR